LSRKIDEEKFASRLKVGLVGDAPLSVVLPAVLPVVAAPTCKSIPQNGQGWSGGITTYVKTRSLCMLLLGMTTLGISTHPVLADGTKIGSWGVNFEDHWYTFGWSAEKEKGATGIRSWSGTDTTFTGQGGWFSSTWTPGGGSWIPDISRQGPGFGALNKMVPNYSVGWTGNGIITAKKDDFYTFGLKFNLANINGWKDYDMTTSYECYIVTHSNKPIDKRDGVKIGTVKTPGEPVPYDCYVFDGYWGNKANGSDGKFKQLYAWRQENSWSGPVNVQAILKFWEEKSGTSFKISTWYIPSGISIAPETFGTSGTFRLENIRIPDLNTRLTTPTKSTK
jgi:hypothetical protein